jgi:hypothetical protein
MSNVMPINPDNESNDERRLNAFGLSTSLFHTSLTAGTSRARSRSALALSSSPGNDVYHDTMEQLALMLVPSGWSLVNVNGQPRLLHPEGLISFTLASATNVAHPDARKKPRTRRKGPATRNSLTAPVVQEMSLFDLPGTSNDAALVAAALASPFWMLLHERNHAGLDLEFSQPAVMTPGGSVVGWSDRIAVPPFDADGDLSVFGSSDDDDDFDVPVERL